MRNQRVRSRDARLAAALGAVASAQIVLVAVTPLVDIPNPLRTPLAVLGAGLLALCVWVYLSNRARSH